MRVFLFKIASKQRWTLYIEKSEFFSKKIDLEPITTTTSTGHPIKETKTNLILNKLKTIAVESKNEIDNAESGVGLKGKLKSLLNYLESKIHPEEAVLQQFSKINDTNLLIKHNHNHNHHNHHNHHNKPHSVQDQFEEFNERQDKACYTIYYPSNIGYRRANRYSQVLMRQKIQYHQKMMVINSLLVPITFAATIVPGPNIFLAYNLYRLYGHYQALKGCINFSKYSKSHGHLLFKPSLEMYECLENIVDETTQEQSQPQTQTQQVEVLNNNNNNSTDPNYEKLSTRLRVPGLFDYVKRIEQLETK